ncbi:putative glucuronyl hydrolase [Metarhizium anisopliae]
MVSQTTTTVENTVNDSPLHGDTGTRNGRLSQLYASNGVLKIWKTATEHLERENPPQSFPETVPQTGPSAGKYRYRDADFWTCGFFPGSLYCLLERSVKYPQRFLTDGTLDGKGSQHDELLRQELPGVCRAWSEPLHEMANRTDTHDMGFIIEPALRRDFELTGDERSLASVVRAAKSLASRYSETTRAIRSWDTFVNNRHQFTDRDKDFLVIIDSMCNLDILYYAGYHSRDQRLIDIATTHARTVCKTHLRREDSSSGSKYGELSTCHVANMCPATGQIVRRFTAQGYSDTSTWARGQSWAILGFAQTYMWTKDVVFLHTACGLAEHFMSRMESSPPCVEVSGKVGRYVPLWDFDAPVDEKHVVRDSAAGVIAANGMLVISGALASLGHYADAQRILESSLAIVEDTLALCYATDGLELVVEQREDGSARVVARSLEQEAEPFDALLRCATANYNRDWTDKYYNHGLVYGDYYLLEYGNRLLQLGYM